MKPTRILLSLALSLAALAGPALAQPSPEQALATVRERIEGALAMVEIDIKNELTDTTARGLGICVSEDGLLMTTGLDARTDPGDIREIRVIPPGLKRQVLPAEFSGLDVRSGMAFIRVQGAYDWQAIQPAETGELQVGQLVCSTGILGSDLGYPVNIGMAYVSTMLRTPDPLVLVTGGELTSIGSPVFNASGEMVGMVRNQLLLNYQMIVPPQRQITVPISGRDRTVFFTPIGEFREVLTNPVTGGEVRRLPWIGVMGFEPLTDSLAETFTIDVPGVLVGKVVEGTPAHRAGLKNGDVIVAVNGKPLEEMPTPQVTLNNFRSWMSRQPIGTEIALDVRGGLEGQRTVNVRLVPIPELPNEAERFVSRELGMVLREKVDLDRYLDENVTGREAGLYVLGVVRDGPAAQARLRQEDLVVSINNQPVETVSQVRQVLDQYFQTNPGQPVRVTVKRGDQSETLSIQPRQ